MARLLVLAALLCVATIAVAQVIPNTPGFQIADVSSYELYKSSGDSAVYRMNIPLQNGTQAYADKPYFVHLVGSRKAIGQDYATLVGDEVLDAYNLVLKRAGVGFAKKKLLEQFLDQQWNLYLSKQVPAPYTAELDGISSVSKHVYQALTRIMVVANFPSDMPEDMTPILNDEKNPDGSPLYTPEEIQVIGEMLGSFKAAQCSMFAIWGTRTVDNQLFSMRNLDYTANSGINPWKSVTVWVPNDGAIPHAAFGFLPLYGVLSGMSKAGITVHEANLEEKNETFRGFPWVIRLRYIMENANNLAEATTLWEKTNNTIGYNHMVASQPDAAAHSTAAVAIETAAHYSAFFHDMDPREENCVVDGSQVGFPLPEALWRTNHPYDPALMNDYLWWGYGAYRWSQQRYVLGHDGIAFYEDNDVLIDYLQAINITATMADKGTEYPHQCVFPYASTKGSNILSVTHQPKSQISFVAWENGMGSTWSPACCNTYTKVDFTKWW